MDLKLRLQTRRDRVIKSLVGDREGKYKRQAALKQIDIDSDASSKSANLRNQLEKLQRQIGKLVSVGRNTTTTKVVEEALREQEKSSNQIIEETENKVEENNRQIEAEEEERKRIEEEENKEETKEMLTPEEYMESLLNLEEDNSSND